MTRRKLELGERGEVECTALIKLDGKWTSTSQTRGAQAWRARVYYRAFDGVLRDVSVRRKTRSQAEEAVKIALAERLGAGDAEITSGSPLLRVAEQWLAHIKPATYDGLSATSKAIYEQTYRRHIDAPGSSIRGLTISQANNVPRLRAFLQGISDNSGEGAAN